MKNDWSDPYKVKIDYSLAPPEFNDVILVLQQAAESGKYGRDDWLKGINFDKEKNYASVRRHHEKSRSGIKNDIESGLNHKLHAACRLLMEYTLERREYVKMKEDCWEHGQYCLCNVCDAYRTLGLEDIKSFYNGGR